MINFNSKKASTGDIYLSPWMFINWMVITICIIIGVGVALPLHADVRPQESYLLSLKLFDCLSKDFSHDYFISKDFDIYERCNISKSLFEETEMYYFKIEIRGLGDSDEDKAIQLIKEAGAKSFDQECKYQLTKEEPYSSLVQCSYRVQNVFDFSKNKSYRLFITTASNQI